MHILRLFMTVLLIAVAMFFVRPAAGVTIRIDYSLDDGANKFFGIGNPQGAAAGAQARAALDAAAAFYSGILEDTLSSIQAPPQFFGSLGATVSWFWQRQFPNPTTGFAETQLNTIVPANEYVVFVGARDLPGSALGNGGPGGYSWQRTGGGSLTPQESLQIEQTTDQFENTLALRGEASGFARWGGALAFDSNFSTWHFNHSTVPTGGATSFYSVALHELAHTLGFGAAQEWNNLVSGTNFIGQATMDQYFLNGPVPLASAADTSHWSLSNTASTIYGTNTTQQSLMSPAITTNLRRLLTNLDAAALVDIGWEIDLPEPVPGDYNGNGIVDAADYTVWRNTLGSTTDLRANGNNSGASAGKIDQADYVFWKASFGNVSGSGSSGSGLPEPPSALLLMLAAAISRFFSRRR